MKRLIVTAGAAVLGGLAAWTTTPVSAATSMTLNFENVATGAASLAYTTDNMGPIPVWGYSAVQQVPTFVASVGGSKVLGLQSADAYRRIHVGLDTATTDGAAWLHSFRLVGTTAPVKVLLFDPGGNYGPGSNGLAIAATGASGSQTITVAAGSTGLFDDRVAEFVVVFGNGAGYVDDFVFESAPCGEEEPPPPPPPPTADGDDWFTGGGWIYGTPSGAKATFGVGGGFKKQGLWGHLNYIDHGTGMHVHWDTITAYKKLDGTRRRVEGTCTIDGTSGFTYVLEVEDNGEPGRQDALDLKLSNGYAAAGTLDGGGNIQLHKALTSKGGKQRKARVRNRRGR